MNKVFLIGNMAADPEAYTTQSGVSRSSFRVAVRRDFRNAQGVREADFLSVVAWRGAADFVNKYMKKGNKVAVVGSIQVRSYDGQDGQKHYVTEIIAESVESLSRPENGDQRAAEGPVNNGNAQSGFVEVDEGDELPF